METCVTSVGTAAGVALCGNVGAEELRNFNVLSTVCGWTNPVLQAFFQMIPYMEIAWSSGNPPEGRPGPEYSSALERLSAQGLGSCLTDVTVADLAEGVTLRVVPVVAKHCKHRPGRHRDVLADHTSPPLIPQAGRYLSREDSIAISRAECERSQRVPNPP
eukprot:gene17333-biopygen12807